MQSYQIPVRDLIHAAVLRVKLQNGSPGGVTGNPDDASCNFVNCFPFFNDFLTQQSSSENAVVIGDTASFSISWTDADNPSGDTDGYTVKFRINGGTEYAVITTNPAPFCTVGYSSAVFTLNCPSFPVVDDCLGGITNVNGVLENALVVTSIQDPDGNGSVTPATSCTAPVSTPT